MSRSKKRYPIIKDRPRNFKKSALYWRKIRRVWAYIIKGNRNPEDLTLPNPKQVVNDYDYSDYHIDYTLWLNLDSEYYTNLINKVKRK
jgi:hypothetical protein